MSTAIVERFFDNDSDDSGDKVVASLDVADTDNSNADADDERRLACLACKGPALDLDRVRIGGIPQYRVVLSAQVNLTAR